MDNWIQYQIWEQSGTQTDNSKWPVRTSQEHGRFCRNDEEIHQAIGNVEIRLAILEEKNFQYNLRIGELNELVKNPPENQNERVQELHENSTAMQKEIDALVRWRHKQDAHEFKSRKQQSTQLDMNQLTEKLFEKKIMQFVTTTVEQKLNANQQPASCDISDNMANRLKDLEKAIGHLNKQIRTERTSNLLNSDLKQSRNENSINFNTADDGTVSG